ncbi:hypothetical protein LPO01_19140 [Ligilactobacillus pobuzihii]|nr:hypothetical protein LPO01_19140 [Ligilactobacillus pobuzihii]
MIYECSIGTVEIFLDFMVEFKQIHTYIGGVKYAATCSVYQCRVISDLDR